MVSSVLFSFSLAGKALAIKYGVKYIETSPGINHNVDELLVGMLAQIQLRAAADAAGGPGAAAAQANGGTGPSASKTSKVGMKVMDLLERVMKIQNSKSKSCGNLHVL